MEIPKFLTAVLIEGFVCVCILRSWKDVEEKKSLLKCVVCQGRPVYHLLKKISATYSLNRKIGFAFGFNSVCFID